MEAYHVLVPYIDPKLHRSVTVPAQYDYCLKLSEKQNGDVVLFQPGRQLTTYVVPAKHLRRPTAIPKPVRPSYLTSKIREHLANAERYEWRVNRTAAQQVLDMLAKEKPMTFDPNYGIINTARDRLRLALNESKTTIADFVKLSGISARTLQELSNRRIIGYADAKDILDALEELGVSDAPRSESFPRPTIDATVSGEKAVKDGQKKVVYSPDPSMVDNDDPIELTHTKQKEKTMARRKSVSATPAADKAAAKATRKQAVPAVTKPAKATATKAPAKRAASANGEKRAPRENTKQAQAIEMLRKGTTIQEMADAFDWQRHTTHGFLAGTIKKKLGFNVTRTKVEDGDPVYKIV